MISLSGSIYILIFLTIIGVGFIFWFYYRTIPEVSVFQKIIFIILRSAAFFLILMVIFGTIVHLDFKQEQPAEIILLVDDSASMRITDKSVKRSETLKKLLYSSDFLAFIQKYQIHSYIFSEEIYKIKNDFLDTLTFKGRGTDIANALISATEQKYRFDPAAILLFSDGNYTIGDNPVRIAKNVHIPVYPVAVGDTAKKSDILITRILTNDITYRNNITSCFVTFKGIGFGNEKIWIQLKKNGNVIDRKRVVVPLNNMESTVKFDFMLNNTGINKLAVEAEYFEKELTSENNIREFYVNVLENKIQIILLASSPSPDLGFLKRILSTDENVDLMVRTHKQSDEFYEGKFPDKTDFDRCNLLILLDFPSEKISASLWQKVQSFIVNKQKPFMFFAGRNFDIDRINSLENFLPCTIERKLTIEAESPVINQENDSHPLLMFDNNNISSWNSLPPVFPACDVSMIKPTDRILIETTKEVYSGESSFNRQPLLIVHQTGKDKSIIFLGYGFYRWDLVMWGIGENNALIKGFMGNAVRWLAVQEDDDRIILKTNKYNYRSGETVFFSVQVYNQAYEPLSDAVVKVNIKTPHSTDEIHLKEMGEGRYSADKKYFAPGTYTITSQVMRNNILLGRDEEEFSVNNYNPEFIDTQVDFSLLRNISSVTGGKFLNTANFDSLDQYVQYPPNQIVVSKEIEFLQSPWILAIIILLFSIDWFLRKQKGML